MDLLLDSLLDLSLDQTLSLVLALALVLSSVLMLDLPSASASLANRSSPKALLLVSVAQSCVAPTRPAWA
jgi:hypothetical protein